MPNNIPCQSRKSMINMHHRPRTLQRLKPVLQQPRFIGNQTFNTVDPLPVEKRLEMLSPLPMEIVWHGQMM